MFRGNAAGTAELEKANFLRQNWKARSRNPSCPYPEGTRKKEHSWTHSATGTLLTHHSTTAQNTSQSCLKQRDVQRKKFLLVFFSIVVCVGFVPRLLKFSKFLKSKKKHPDGLRRNHSGICLVFTEIHHLKKLYNYKNSPKCVLFRYISKQVVFW